jgi:hypothetical protein
VPSGQVSPDAGADVRGGEFENLLGAAMTPEESNAGGELVSLATADLDAVIDGGPEGVSVPAAGVVLGSLNRFGEIIVMAGSELAEAMNALRAKKEAAAASRFNPDLILGIGEPDEAGGNFDDVSVKDLLEELKDLEPAEDAAQTPVEDDADGVGLPAGLPVLDLPAEIETDGEEADLPEISLADAQEPETETDGEAVPLAEADAALLMAANSDGAEEVRPPEAEMDEIKNMAVSFAEVRDSRPGEGGDNPNRDDDSHRSERTQLPQFVKDDADASHALSKPQRRADNPGASGATSAHDAPDFGEAAGRAAAGSFASELSTAMTSRGEQAAPSANPVPSMPLPGAETVLNPDNAFGDGLTNVLEFMKNDGTNQARIVVEPPALGRVDVSLQATASGLEASFRVDNEHLRQMLQQQLDTLKASLQAQGIHVSSLEVDIKNRDDQKGRGDLYETGKKGRRAGGIDGTDGEPAGENRLVRLDLERGLLHWVA